MYSVQEVQDRLVLLRKQLSSARRSAGLIHLAGYPSQSQSDALGRASVTDLRNLLLFARRRDTAHTTARLFLSISRSVPVNPVSVCVQQTKKQGPSTQYLNGFQISAPAPAPLAQTYGWREASSELPRSPDSGTNRLALSRGREVTSIPAWDKECLLASTASASRNGHRSRILPHFWTSSNGQVAAAILHPWEDASVAITSWSQFPSHLDTSPIRSPVKPAQLVARWATDQRSGGKQFSIYR